MAGVIILDRDPHHLASVGLLESRIVDGFSSSVFTIAEAPVHPARAGRQDAALGALLRIGVRIISLETSAALQLARVRSDYRLRMPDAVALHTAINTGSELASFDDTLIAAAIRAEIPTTAL